MSGGREGDEESIGGAGGRHCRVRKIINKQTLQSTCIEVKCLKHLKVRWADILFVTLYSLADIPGQKIVRRQMIPLRRWKMVGRQRGGGGGDDNRKKLRRKDELRIQEWPVP